MLFKTAALLDVFLFGAQLSCRHYNGFFISVVVGGYFAIIL